MVKLYNLKINSDANHSAGRVNIIENAHLY